MLLEKSPQPDGNPHQGRPRPSFVFSRVLSCLSQNQTRWAAREVDVVKRPVCILRTSKAGRFAYTGHPPGYPQSDHVEAPLLSRKRNALSVYSDLICLMIRLL